MIVGAPEDREQRVALQASWRHGRLESAPEEPGTAIGHRAHQEQCDRYKDGIDELNVGVLSKQ